MRRVNKWLDKGRLRHTVHGRLFHTAHGYSHVAYFVAVLAEGHGFYAIIGGVMVVFSLITVLADEEET